jgi:hypothetical protein
VTTADDSLFLQARWRTFRRVEKRGEAGKPKDDLRMISSASDTSVAASPDPYDVFARARAAVTTAHYPASLRYTIAVSGVDGAMPRENHYRAYCHPNEGFIDVAPISEEETAAPPPVVHGINFALTAGICGGRCDTGSGSIAVPVGHSSWRPDLIGVPVLEPTYMFGLAYAENTAPARATNGVSALPVIATVSSAARAYRITFDGTAVIDGVSTYHLSLVPVRKPHDNRLRELWVGAGDYLPRKAVLAGNFSVAPLVDVPWMVTFAVRNGAPLIASELAEATLYLAHRHVVRDAVIAFEQVRDSDDSLIDKPLVEPEADETTLVEPNTSR